jgi:hypothetical protein
MALTITHAKTNAIADWSQATLDAVIAGTATGLPPAGTTLNQIVLPSDWNDDHTITFTGSDTQVLFFDGANNPAGDAGLTYNKTTDKLSTVALNLSGLTASKFVATDASKNLVSTTLAVPTIATGLTATGANQGTALALSGDNSFQEITGGAVDTGVLLPAAVAGSVVTIKNTTSTRKRVWPAAGDSINGLGVNTHVVLGAYSQLTFRAKDATVWYTEFNSDTSSGATVYNSNFQLPNAYNIVNSGVTAATYGSASAVGQFAVGADGRVTGASNQTIDISYAQINNLQVGFDELQQSDMIHDFYTQFVYAGGTGNPERMDAFTVDTPLLYLDAPYGRKIHFYYAGTFPNTTNNNIRIFLQWNGNVIWDSDLSPQPILNDQAGKWFLEGWLMQQTSDNLICTGVLSTDADKNFRVRNDFINLGGANLNNNNAFDIYGYSTADAAGDITLETGYLEWKRQAGA